MTDLSSYKKNRGAQKMENFFNMVLEKLIESKGFFPLILVLVSSVEGWGLSFKNVLTCCFLFSPSDFPNSLSHFFFFFFFRILIHKNKIHYGEPEFFFFDTPKEIFQSGRKTPKKRSCGKKKFSPSSLQSSIWSWYEIFSFFFGKTFMYFFGHCWLYFFFHSIQFEFKF